MHGGLQKRLSSRTGDRIQATCQMARILTKELPIQPQRSRKCAIRMEVFLKIYKLKISSKNLPPHFSVQAGGHDD